MGVIEACTGSPGSGINIVSFYQLQHCSIIKLALDSYVADLNDR